MGIKPTKTTCVVADALTLISSLVAHSCHYYLFPFFQDLNSGEQIAKPTANFTPHILWVILYSGEAGL